MKFFKSKIFYFLSIILLALFCKLFVIDILYISGSSMEPTLISGSFILINKLSWGIPVPYKNKYWIRWGEPHSENIVIYPWLDRYVIKRCVGTAGTQLVFSEKTGYSVDIGNRHIPLTEEQYKKLSTCTAIPSGMIFTLGDNVKESRDSRDYGFVSVDSIRGKVLWK